MTEIIKIMIIFIHHKMVAMQNEKVEKK